MTSKKPVREPGQALSVLWLKQLHSEVAGEGLDANIGLADAQYKGLPELIKEAEGLVGRALFPGDGPDRTAAGEPAFAGGQVHGDAARVIHHGAGGVEDDDIGDGDLAAVITVYVRGSVLLHAVQTGFAVIAEGGGLVV